MNNKYIDAAKHLFFAKPKTKPVKKTPVVAHKNFADVVIPTDLTSASMIDATNYGIPPSVVVNGYTLPTRDLARRYKFGEINDAELTHILTDPVSNCKLNFPNPEKDFNLQYFKLCIVNDMLPFVRINQPELTEVSFFLYMHFLEEFFGKDSNLFEISHSYLSFLGLLLDRLRLEDLDNSSTINPENFSKFLFFIFDGLLPELRKIDENIYRRFMDDEQRGFGGRSYITHPMLYYLQHHLYPQILTGNLSDIEKDFIKLNSSIELRLIHDNLLADPENESWIGTGFSKEDKMDLPRKELIKKAMEINKTHRLWAKQPQSGQPFAPIISQKIR